MFLINKSKKINNNNSLNNNNHNHNNNNNNNNNDNIFYNKIWKNIVLRKIILQYVFELSVKYKYYETQSFDSVEEFNNFKYKEYISRILINFKYSDKIFSCNNSCLDNIKSLNFVTSFEQHPESLININSVKSLPKHITSLNVPSGFDIDLIKDLNNLQFLSILNYSLNGSFKIQDNQLPKSITELELINYEYPISRSSFSTYNNDNGNGNGSSNGISNENGNESSNNCGLNKLVLNYYENKFKVQIESIPESVKTLCIFSRLFSSDLLLNIFKFNNQLVYLKIGYIGCFKIPSTFRFPESLKELYVGLKSLPKGFKFPKGLKNLKLYLGEFSNPNKTVKIFSRLKHLEYLNLDIEMDNCSKKPLYDCSILPRSLKRLQISNVFGLLIKAQLLPNQLPPNLENLIFNETHINQFTNDNRPLTQDNIFPPSLEECHFDSAFNQPIGQNSFPKDGKLKFILFGDNYNQSIPSNAFPATLESILITNHYYEHCPVILTTSDPFIQCKNDFKERMKYYYSRPNQMKSVTLNDQVLVNKSLIFDKDEYYSLRNKINLEKICINWDFNVDFNNIYNYLPQDNNIKFINILSPNKFIIDLDQFQKLEVIDIGISDTTFKTSFNQNGGPNLYNLKSILLPKSSSSSVYKLNEYFYSFLKFY